MMGGGRKCEDHDRGSDKSSLRMTVTTTGNNKCIRHTTCSLAKAASKKKLQSRDQRHQNGIHARSDEGIIARHRAIKTSKQ